jgi:hypothetical protein
VICFEEFEVSTITSKLMLSIRLAIGYPGRSVCVIFIGIVFAIGFGSEMVALCISLEARFFLQMGFLNIHLGRTTGPGYMLFFVGFGVTR